MRRIAISLSIAALAVLTVVAAVSAASPAPTRMGGQVARDQVLTEILGLTSAELMELRHDGLTLAQIAERQKVDPQKLIDALAAQWSARIDVRLAAGALTADQAATLKANLAVQAKGMVNQATPGGMQGAAVGAGRGMGGARGMGAGRDGRDARARQRDLHRHGAPGHRDAVAENPENGTARTIPVPAVPSRRSQSCRGFSSSMTSRTSSRSSAPTSCVTAMTS